MAEIERSECNHHYDVMTVAGAGESRGVGGPIILLCNLLGNRNNTTYLTQFLFLSPSRSLIISYLIKDNSIKKRSSSIALRTT